MISIPSLFDENNEPNDKPLNDQVVSPMALTTLDQGDPRNSAMASGQKTLSVIRLLANRLIRAHRPILKNLGDREVTYRNRKYPAVVLSISRATKEAEIALFKAGSVYVFMADLSGTKSRRSFTGRRTGNVKSVLRKNTGMDASGVRSATAKWARDGAINAGGGVNSIGGPSGGAGRSMYAIATSPRYSDFEMLVTNKIQDIVHGTDVSKVDQTSAPITGEGTDGENIVESTSNHTTVGFHHGDEVDFSEDFSDATFVAFDFYGEGSGVYVAVDSILPGKQGTLSSVFANESSEETESPDWTNTTVELVGPIPHDIDRLKTREGWSAVTSVQAESRSEALVKVSEAIQNLGFGAQTQFGVIRVEVAPEAAQEETGSDEDADDINESTFVDSLKDESGKEIMSNKSDDTIAFGWVGKYLFAHDGPSMVHTDMFALVSKIDDSDDGQDAAKWLNTKGIQSLTPITDDNYYDIAKAARDRSSEKVAPTDGRLWTNKKVIAFNGIKSDIKKTHFDQIDKLLGIKSSDYKVVYVNDDVVAETTEAPEEDKKKD